MRREKEVVSLGGFSIYHCTLQWTHGDDCAQQKTAKKKDEEDFPFRMWKREKTRIKSKSLIHTTRSIAKNDMGRE